MGGDAIDLVGAELGYLSGPLLGGREELREGNLEVGQLLACLAFIFDAREHYQGGSSLVHGRERNSRLAAEQRLDEVHVDPLRGKRGSQVPEQRPEPSRDARVGPGSEHARCHAVQAGHVEHEQRARWQLRSQRGRSTRLWAPPGPSSAEPGADVVLIIERRGGSASGAAAGDRSQA